MNKNKIIIVIASIVVIAAVSVGGYSAYKVTQKNNIAKAGVVVQTETPKVGIVKPTVVENTNSVEKDKDIQKTNENVKNQKVETKTTGTTKSSESDSEKSSKSSSNTKTENTKVEKTNNENTKANKIDSENTAAKVNKSNSKNTESKNHTNNSDSENNETKKKVSNQKQESGPQRALAILKASLGSKANEYTYDKPHDYGNGAYLIGTNEKNSPYGAVYLVKADGEVVEAG